MKKKSLRKFLKVGILLALLLTIPFNMSAVAEESESVPKLVEDNQTDENFTGYFASFRGTIREVTNYVNQKGEEVESFMYVLAENESGEIVNFFVTDSTYMITDSEIAVDSEIIGFYDAQAPVLMIYPPQYRAVAVAVDFPADQSVKVDKFDEDFVSSDNMLKLNIADTTEIIYQDGTKFDGEIAELTNRTLAVVYGISTRSIPAQTTPSRITILNENDNDLSDIESGHTDDLEDSDNMDIIINGIKIDSPEPYKDEQENIMVPLRAVAEALGYGVVWNDETQSVMLDDTVSLALGKNYVMVETESIELQTAPILVADAYTYVPLDFFKTVMKIENIEIIESQIVINNEVADNGVITLD